MYDWLDEATRDNAQIVTANRRLVRVLRQEYAKQQITAGCLAWRTPVVIEWQDWVADLLVANARLTAVPTVLSRQQSKLLWERCLRREISDPLLNIGQLAKLSRDTWDRLREWRVSLEEVEASVRNKDQRLFATACGYYQSILERENWLDDVGVVEQAIAELQNSSAAELPAITLAGFDRVSPLLQRMLDAYTASGGTVQRYEREDRLSSDNPIEVLAFANVDAELRAAGAWAREQIAQRPDAQVAIVVSQLEQDARRSLRLVKEGLLPGWQNAGTSQNALINISYGQKLTEFPVIATALLALRWLHSDLGSVEVSSLLRSTVLGDAINHRRIKAELRLRQYPDQRWTSTRLLAYVRGGARTEDNDGLEFIASLVEIAEQLPARQSPGQWVEMFNRVLEKLGWPGGAPLSSHEFQTINRWRELLNEFARLELVAATMSVAEALSRIAAIAAETVFQPESKSGAVQLLGPLEAAGLEFDELWVSGANGSNWPPQGRPLALVSRDLQRKFDLPDSTPANTLEFAKRVFRGLTSSAASIHASYALTANDAQQSASEFLEEAGARQAVADDTAKLDPGWYAARLQEHVELVPVESDPVPSFAKQEVLSGGAATIQKQFVQPFSAFAIGRLGLQELWPIQPGLAANVRGSLIHAALQNLYADRPSSDAIRQWEEGTRNDKTNRAVARAFGATARHASDTLQRILAFEAKRVAELLLGVIDVDKGREEFAIAEVELDVEATIGELPLRLRIDRVDLDASGQQILIDYKTGTPKKLLGRDKTPADMQLVVYAGAIPGAVSGIALFNVDSRSVTLDGIGRDFGPELEWDKALPTWVEQVEIAADEIVAGDVRLNLALSLQQSRPLALLSRIREVQSGR